MPKKAHQLPRTTVRLPEDIHRAAKLAASQRAEPVQEFIAECIRIRLIGMGLGAMLSEEKFAYERLRRAGD